MPDPIQRLPVEEVFSALVASPEGLAETEARRRFAEFGPNEIEEARRRPLLGRFMDQLRHFLALLLWIAAVMCFISEALHPGEGMLTLGLAIVAVILINALFTFVQEYRAEKALAVLRKLLPFNVRGVRDGREKSLAARELVPGDLVFLNEGDKVPADIRLVEAARLKVNNAPLTGESEPLLCDPREFRGDLLESPNIVFAGTTVVGGSGRGVVYATGMRTEFGRIAHLTSAIEPGLSPLQKEIVKASRIVAAIAAAVGIFFFSVGFVIGRGFWHNFLFGIGITVALIPEGLLPTVTLALAMGSQRMAKKKALIKTLTSVETLGSVTVICTDKTGTLTLGKMKARKVWSGNRVLETRELKKEESLPLLRVAYFCNNARYAEGEYRGDPTEAALFQMAREISGDLPGERLAEIPFDSERKRMTTLHVSEGKLFVLVKGALEKLLPLCRSVLERERQVLLDEAGRERLLEAQRGLADEGLRVLALAYRAASELGPAGPPRDPETELQRLEANLVLAGLVGLEDPPRPEVTGAIHKCREAGIKIIMITGDAGRTALAIGRETGLAGEAAELIEGSEAAQMSDRALRAKLEKQEVIFARMTPKHKMRMVSLLKEMGEVVAVTGDGVNDAPALKKADIGVAMGISGTDVAKEASDMVLLDDNFATIVSAVEEGRAVYENIKKFITYIFSSNIPEAVPYLAYILFRIPLPLRIIQILAVDLGTDVLPALALGAEKPSAELMTRPPRQAKERMIDAALIGRAYLFLGPIEAAAGMFGFFWVLRRGGWVEGTMLGLTDPLYLQATTACLTAIIVTQVGNVLACRSARESIFRVGLLTNKLIFLGLAVEILLQAFVVYHPWGNAIFATHPISLRTWLMLVPFAAALLLLEELRKLVAARWRRRGERFCHRELPRRRGPLVHSGRP